METNKEKIRKICERFFIPKTLNDCYEFFRIYAECFFRFIENQAIKDETQISRRDAKLVTQMIFTKTLSLKKILEGIDYNSHDELKLNTIIDPTIIAILVRSIYETVLMFNVVYIQPKTDDERLILYNLWVHSGLSFRQRFKYNTTSKANKEKLDDELLQMEQLKTEIHNTSLYKSLSETNKKRIETRLKGRDYKIIFDENNDIQILHWQDIPIKMGLREGLFNNIYTYFSIYAHPSNVAVFQFQDMFKENTAFINLTMFNSKSVFILLGAFIADLLKLFPELLSVFEKLPYYYQISISFQWRTYQR
ncbi:MAG: DUF5677 domain-containing protein [Prevotellaceae bacterium]|jgi:hypothetical protein|nr:DUF5677 domain-containing protein [Prevotellaceae bacterium]